MIQFIFEAKVILKKMVYKIILCFSQYTDILKGLLVVIIILIIGHLKYCLIKMLQLLLQVIINYLSYLSDYVSYFVTKTRVRFNRSCWKQDKITHDHGKVKNIYIAYEISKNFNFSSYATLENCLFGAVSLTKNADIDKYKYFGCGIGFDTHGCFSHPSGGTVRNAIILRVNMSSSIKIDNRKRHFNSWQRPYTKTRRYTECIKNVFN